MWINGPHFEKRRPPKFDLETAEITFTYGAIIDPYGVESDPYGCVGRSFFARAPGTTSGFGLVIFPETTVKALQDQIDRGIANYRSDDESLSLIDAAPREMKLLAIFWEVDDVTEHVHFNYQQPTRKTGNQTTMPL